MVTERTGHALAIKVELELVAIKPALHQVGARQPQRAKVRWHGCEPHFEFAPEVQKTPADPAFESAVDIKLQGRIVGAARQAAGSARRLQAGDKHGQHENDACSHAQVTPRCCFKPIRMRSAVIGWLTRTPVAL